VEGGGEIDQRNAERCNVFEDDVSEPGARDGKVADRLRRGRRGRLTAPAGERSSAAIAPVHGETVQSAMPFGTRLAAKPIEAWPCPE
jgi:hypothetical protein